ncbi:hypothetical protein TRVL_01296 [Trypanosoma vivax]|nr:hypothetical protein TRVL_01296 [Trypanosoma vivax]
MHQRLQAWQLIRAPPRDTESHSPRSEPARTVHQHRTEASGVGARQLQHSRSKRQVGPRTAETARRFTNAIFTRSLDDDPHGAHLRRGRRPRPAQKRLKWARINPCGWRRAKTTQGRSEEASTALLLRRPHRALAHAPVVWENVCGVLLRVYEASTLGGICEETTLKQCEGERLE